MAKKEKALTISPPNHQVAKFRLIGTAPYVQQKFSAKAKAAIKAKQEAGDTAKKGKKREPKDFQACYEGAIHRTRDGHFGIPATAFRKAMIDACRSAGFTMTIAKQAVFTCADGFDPEDGTPLVRFVKGEPHYFESAVRQQRTMDLRPRPMWDEGWEVDLRVRYDAGLFTLEDVGNLLLHAGISVGVGEGRPFSRDSAGCGWGTFTLAGREE